MRGQVPANSTAPRPVLYEQRLHGTQPGGNSLNACPPPQQVRVFIMGVSRWKWERTRKGLAECPQPSQEFKFSIVWPSSNSKFKTTRTPAELKGRAARRGEEVNPHEEKEERRGPHCLPPNLWPRVSREFCSRTEVLQPCFITGN